MTDTVLYFGLGFAIAGLISVLILPIIWNQAGQLTKKRMEATSPINSVEVAAAHDLEKAEFAVAIRQLELRIEELQQQAGNYWYELESSRNRISKLLSEQNEKKSQMDSLQHEISQVRLQNTDLSKKSSQLQVESDSSNRAELEELRQSSHQEIELLQNQLALEKSQQMELEAKLVSLNEQLTESEKIKSSLTLQVKEATAKLADLEGQVTEAKKLPGKSKESSKELLESKKSVETLSNKLAQTENQLNETQSELTKMQEQLSESQKKFEQDDSNEQIMQLEQELTGAIAERDQLKASNAALQDQISAPAAEAKLKEADSSAESIETTRRKLSEFAAQFVAFTANQNGENSKMQEILAEESKTAKGAVGTLAEKIRKFSNLNLKSDKSNEKANSHKDNAQS